jgi:hypothetical protein
VAESDPAVSRYCRLGGGPPSSGLRTDIQPLRERPQVPEANVQWDDSTMSEKIGGNSRDLGPHQHAHAAPTTQQMRTVGQRRRDAEEKLEHHLQEARHKHDPHDDDATEQEDGGAVGGRDVAAVQNDDRLTAADRVDLIANQAVTQGEDAGKTPEPDGGS